MDEWLETYNFPTRETPRIKNVRLYIFRNNEFEDNSRTAFKRDSYLEKLKKLGEFKTSKNTYKVYGSIFEYYLGSFEFLADYVISDIVYISLVRKEPSIDIVSKVLIDVDNSNKVLIERSRTTVSGRFSIRDSSKDPEMTNFDWELLLKLEEFLKNRLESGELLDSCMQFLEN